MTFPFTRGIPDSVQKKEPVLGLTPMGKQKVEQFDGSGPMFLMLAYLQENGACSVSQVSRGLNMDKDKVKVMGRQLISEGLVRRVD